jgi:two-component system CheB/CheR fusion protein
MANQPTHYVGIGASAGGLEAIESFFKNMPEKNGLAFIIVQHLSPDYESLMPELLARHTHMSVRRAEDGLAVEANTVYLIAPKKNLQIFHGKLLFTDQDRSQGLNLPIDIFLNSLAEDQENKAIAIILSGTGSDGTRGIRTIKGNSGMVMAQQPEDAKFDGMPASAIATGLVDFILPVEAMPSQLLSFVQHPNIARSEYIDRTQMSDDALTRIFALLRQECKVDFTHYKPSTITRRLERRMGLHQITNLQDYVVYLESVPQEITALYRELLIGVTNFFRDPEVFHELAEIHLPALLDSIKTMQDIRFWCAGCSTGEEAYTLAILIKEYMRKTQKRLNIKIFATDVDETAIAQASAGVYPDSILADVGEAFLTRYFVPVQGQQFQVTRELREIVVFARHNLIKDPPFTNIDLISCRNLLIYLEPVLQQRVLGVFNFALKADGLLVLGNSENIGDHAEYFTCLDNKAKLFSSKGNRKPIGLSSVATLSFSKEISGEKRLRHGGIQRQEDERLLERLLNSLADDYAPPALVVNESRELLHVLGNAGDYLRITAGRLSNDVTKMVSKEVGIALSTGLLKVFKNQQEIRYSNVRIDSPGGALKIDLRLKALAGRKNQTALAVIFFEHIDATARDNEGELKNYDLGAEAEQRISDLEQELQFTRENLQATVEELETSNEELQATNEELLASNEELQSTNEELQSVNEELHTVNAEHQRKIFELSELTNDLDNLFVASRIATLFLDINLEIRRFTPETTKLFPLSEKEIGRAFSSLTHNIRHADPGLVAKSVLKDGKIREYEIQAANDYWYLMRVTPYNVGANHVIGAVIVFIDIHERKKERDTTQFYFDFAATMLVAINVNRSIQRINRTASEVLGYAPDELRGRDWFDTVIPEADRETVVNIFNDIMAGRLDPFKYVETLIVTKSGEKRLIAWRNTLLRDEQNRIIGTLSSGDDITERKRMETALRQSEMRLKLAQEAAEIGSWEWHINSGDIYWSDNVEKIFGMSPGSFQGTLEAFMARVHPHDQVFVQKAIDNALKGKQNYCIEHRIIPTQLLKQTSSAQEYWVEEKGKIFYDDAGKPNKMIGTVRNISVDKHLHILQQQAEALRQSEARFRGAFDFAPHGMALVSPSGRWLRVNPYLCHLLGYSEQALLQTDFQSITHADDLANDLNYVKDMLAGNIKTYSMYKRYFNKNGIIVPILLSVVLVRDDKQQPVHFVVQIYPQGEWNDNHTDDLDSNAWFYGMAILSTDEHWLKVNNIFCRALGYSQKELLAMDMSAVTHADDLALARTYIANLHSGKLVSCTLKQRYRQKTGQLITALVKIALRQDDNGERFLMYIQPVSAPEND